MSNMLAEEAAPLEPGSLPSHPRRMGGRRKPGDTGKTSPGLFLEQFLAKNFKAMPAWLRATVYLLLVLTFIHSYLKPTTLEGQLDIETQGHTRPAQNYVIESGHSRFLTNPNGKWVLQTSRTIPGSISATVYDPSGEVLGQVRLILPLPIYSAVVEHPYLITYRQSESNMKQRFVVASNPDLSLVSTAYADETSRQPLALPEPAAPRNLVVGIKELDVRESGDHDDSVGTVYAEVYLNGRRMRTPRLPQEGFPNTYLTLRDNSQNFFNSFLFAVPFPGGSVSHTLEIRLYEADFFGHDDLIGVFKTKVGAADIGKELTLKTGKLKRHWPDNATIVLQVGPEPVRRTL